MRRHFWLLLLLMAGLLAGCQDVRSPQVVKIGLIAPFEGPSRPLGYDVLYAVKLRIKQWNESDARPKIELVALNDDGDPALAAILPKQLAQDDGVRAILGPPQGHTAQAVALGDGASSGIPTLLLAPIPGSAPAALLPYAGTGPAYQQALAGVGDAAASWDAPLSGPGIWLGAPLTLAELLVAEDEHLLAAGPVAEETAVRGWAGERVASLPWAAPEPQHLPADFAAAYHELAGKAPTRAAALAYAATDEALRLIAAAPDYRPGVEALHTITPPPIRIQP